MWLLFFIGTFLSDYDVTYRKLKYVLTYTSLYKNEQIEREIIQWRLLIMVQLTRMIYFAEE